MMRVRWSRWLRAVARAVVCAALVFAPGCGDTVTHRATGDLNGDGEREEYRLTGGRLTVSAGDVVLWRSPAAWRVDSFALGDVTGDGAANLVFSLWKKGSYGPRRPFWETGVDRSYKNHLFVYRLTADGIFSPVWCSSDLDRPIVSFEIRAAPGDGPPELVVAEGAYRRVFGARYALDETAPVRTTVWRWSGWGFQRCS